ncbi:MAG TPA: threonine/serine dehydratase [Vicinamibacterales bacterium]|jgi:threonine dehydratase
MPDLVNLEAIREAAKRIGGTVRRTPVLDVSHAPASPLWLKCENLQLGGAFKIRGALNMVGRLDPASCPHGVITYSSGNHGRAVALAARLAGIPATVVMPVTAPAIKVGSVKELGAHVILEGTTSADRKERAEREAQLHGLTIVPPFDHEWIIAGQGTIALEVFEQCPGLSEVYVPVGGGGLISGIAAGIKQLGRGIRVVGVEPAGAAKMCASLAAGQPVTLPGTASIADGLLPVRPGDLTFAHVREFVDEVVTVEDKSIAKAVGWLFQEAKLVVEPSGAAALAAATHARESARSRGAAVAIVSGGNIAAAELALLTSPNPS